MWVWTISQRSSLIIGKLTDLKAGFSFEDRVDSDVYDLLKHRFLGLTTKSFRTVNLVIDSMPVLRCLLSREFFMDSLSSFD